MARLSKSDALYLKNDHGIDVSETFDGSQMTIREIRAHMSAEQLLVAYGKPCIRDHNIRAAGGCVRCNPQVIAHAKRARKSGFVYIAKSAETRLIKIGFSENPPNRIYIARCMEYGGISDWKVRYFASSHKAGRVEIVMKDLLRLYHYPISFIEKVRARLAVEIYKCSLKYAYETLAENVGIEKIKSIR